MKKIFVCVVALLMCACVYNMTRVFPAYGLTITEDFNGYATGNIIGSSAGTDPGWSGTWGNNSQAILECKAGPAGYFTLVPIWHDNEILPGWVQRNFSESITPSSTAKTTFTVTYSGVVAFANIYSSFILRSGLTDGISIGYHAEGWGDTRQFGYFTGQDATGFVAWKTPIADNTTYNVTLDNINFTTKTYSVKVDGDENTYSGTFVNNVASFDRLALYVRGWNANDHVAPQTTIDNIHINVEAVPEPSSVAFFGIGLIGLIGGLIRERTVARNRI